MSSKPADALQRQWAVKPEASMHVEAPAGSGKTSVLLERFLILLSQVEEPEAVLALTFTNKAAGELRTRLFNLLLTSGSTHPGGAYEQHLQHLALQAARRHVDLGWAALQERLQILTFHSFCARLVRQMPYAVGLPPEFSLLEDEEAARLRLEAVEEMRQRLARAPAADPRRQALLRRLVRLNNNWPQLATELSRLINRRDTLGPFLELARTSQDPAAYESLLVQQLRQLLGPRLERLQNLFLASELGRQWTDFHGTLVSCGSCLAPILPATLPGTALEDLQSWQRVAEGLLTSNDACYRSFSAPKFPKPFKDTVWAEQLAALPSDLVAELKALKKLPVLLLQPDEVPALQDLIILLGEVLGDYYRLCRQRNRLDFIALEEAALALLADQEPSELLLRLDCRLSHILVDEFQDTSQNQLLLLCRLLAGWTPGDGRTLMVVGDPKQSIYEWRNARLELFTWSRQGLPCPTGDGIPLTPVILTTNFRSTRTLIAWVNQVFGSTIMAEPTLAGVEFHPATPAPGAARGEPPQLALFYEREAEARWLAGEVGQLVANLNPAEKIGLLLFTRTHLQVYLQAFREVGLKPRIRDGLPLAASQSVQHLHNLVTALVHPHDELAWAALLPGFGRQTELAVLATAASLPEPLWLAKLERLGQERPESQLRKLAAALGWGLRQVGHRPLVEIVWEVLARIAGWETIAAWEGAAGVANCRSYLELLATAAAPSPAETLERVTLACQQAYQPPDPQAQDSPVEILTVHTAKGLEYDYVFVPFLDYSPLNRPTDQEPFLVEENPQTGKALLALRRPTAKEEQSVLFSLLQQLEQQRRLAETRRLFYVAVTRAKKQLWLSGKIKDQARTFPVHSPLGWLAEHYGQGPPQSDAPVVWEEPSLWVRLNPPAPTLRLSPPPLAEAGEPLEVPPDPWPYRLKFPSELAAFQASPEGPEPETWFRERGELIHRLLETVAAGRPLPELATVIAAARQQGLPPAAAAALAPAILAEVTACLQDPWLARFLAPDLPLARSEWLLEGWGENETLIRGQVDRVVFDGQDWWILDYKTSRPAPGQDWETFLEQEANKYRPQLEAYRQLVAHHLGLNPAAIKLALYFTADRRSRLL